MQNFIPQLWASRALEQLFANSFLVGLVNRNFSNELANKGKILNIPKYGTLNVNEMGSEVTPQDPSGSTIQLELDKHFEITIQVDDVDKAQQDIDVLGGYVDQGMKKMGEHLDAQIMGLYPHASGTVGTLGTALNEATILNIRKTFNQNKISKRDRYLVVDSDGTNELLVIERYTEVDKIGNNRNIIDGMIGRVSGLSVFENEDVAELSAGKIGIAFQRESILIATRPLPAPEGMGVRSFVASHNGIGLRVLYSFNPSTLKYQVTIDLLWGSAVAEDRGLLQVRY